MLHRLVRILRKYIGFVKSCATGGMSWSITGNFTQLLRLTLRLFSLDDGNGIDEGHAGEGAIEHLAFEVGHGGTAVEFDDIAFLRLSRL